MKLAGSCDVVVENFSRRVMKNFGFNYEIFKKANPDIIMVSMPAFGLDGPDMNHVAFGATLEAMMGVTYLTGYEDGGPMCMSGTAYTDPIGGINSALSILMALRHKRRTGEGCYVEVPQLEAVFPFVAQAIMDYTMNGRIEGRMGNRHYFKAPHGCYPCRGDDAWVAVSVSSETEWERFCRVIGRLDLTSDERFSNQSKRWENQGELDPIIGDWTKAREPYEVMRILQDAGIASGPVLNSAQIITDPQRLASVEARGFYDAAEHPVAKTACTFISHPRLSETKVGIKNPAPCFGQHNSYVFQELMGLSRQEIKELEDERIISSVYLEN